MLIKHSLPMDAQQVLQRASAAAPESRRPQGNQRQRWSANGPGPVAMTCGDWMSGVVLGPHFEIRSPSQVVSLSWDWSHDKLGEWRDQAHLRLMILDVESRSCWTLDVTDRPQSAMIIPSDIQISANCVTTLQLKAGERTGRAFSPPYVRSIDVAVHFRT